MIKRARFPKIFFGWWTVLAGGLLSLWGHGYYIGGMSVLLKPIASELGLSRAATSVGASIGRLEGGLEGPLTGWIIDRFGPRVIATLGIFVAGAGFILMNYVDSLWAYYVAWGVIAGSGVNIGLSLPFDKAITNWFVKKRGVALGIKGTILGGAPVLMTPLVAWLISVQGWRTACLIGGVVMWLVGLPLAWFLIKQDRPEYYGLLPDGATAEEEATDVSQMIGRGVKYAAEVQEVEFTLRQAMRTRAYWLLVLANAAHGMVQSAIILHSVAFVTDMGVEPVKAAMLLGLFAIAGLPRFVGGLLADRLKKSHIRFLMGGAYLLQAVGFTIFLLNQTIAMVYVLFILYFLASGVTIPLPGIIRGRYFGRKAFGSIAGVSSAIVMPVGVAAPIYAGWIYDTTGSYITTFTLFAPLLALAAVLMFLAVPPRPPAQVTDIRKIV